MKPRRKRFKTTQHILLPNQGMMKSLYDNLRDGIDEFPPTYNWNGLRPLRVEDVDIWEVILENGRLGIGVYAAWCPYDELYIVASQGTISHEFYGFNANEQLEKFLIMNNIDYPKTNKPVEYKNIPVEKIYIPL
jgi:hypothetical protein